MTDAPDTDGEMLMKAQVYEMRRQIERDLFRRPNLLERFRRFLLLCLGAAAVGCLAAGVSLLVLVVLLNLVFHFNPT